MLAAMISVIERALDNGAAMALICGWIVCHFAILVPVSVKRYAKAGLIAMGLLLVLVYLLKPFTYDLPKYSLYFDYSSLASEGFTLDASGEVVLTPTDREGPFCPFGTGEAASFGFCTLIAATREFLPQGAWLIPRLNAEGKYISDSLFLVVMMFGLGSVLFAMILWRDGIRGSESLINQLLYALPFTLGSVFFFVGSQNSVRQFLGISLIMLSVSLWSSKRYIGAVVAGLFAVSMHQWIWVFLGLVLVVMVWLEYLESCRGLSVRNGIITTGLVPLVIGTLGVAGLHLAWSATDLSTLLGQTRFFGEVTSYISGRIIDDVWRVDVFAKVLFVGLVFFVSEMMLTKGNYSQPSRLQLIRRAIFFSILPAMVFEPIFGRLLYLYWGFELLLLFQLSSSANPRKSSVGAVIFVSYAIMPNAGRVLIGLDTWKEILYG